MHNLAFLLLITACSMSIGPDQPKSAKKTYYTVKYAEHTWEKPKEENSDYVFINKDDGRVMLSNSFCEEFQDRPLDQLARQTLKLVKELKIKKEEYITFHNREAYKTIGQGKVDGVAVELQLLNTRRNNCYFDFVAITPLSIAPRTEKDFKKFLDSVEFK